jgi:hypothetical protein
MSSRGRHLPAALFRIRINLPLVYPDAIRALVSFCNHECMKMQRKYLGRTNNLISTGETAQLFENK